MWVLHNKSKIDWDQHTDFNDFCFVTDKCFLENEKNDLRIYSEGNIIFRNNIRFPNNNEKILDLYLKNGKSFIDHIKGDFIIIIIYRRTFALYSGRFAIRKFFYWQCGKNFIISNSLKEITRKVKVDPSQLNMLLYSLTYHFVGGLTLFKDVYHNAPAQVIEYDGSALKLSNYWDPLELLRHKIEKIDIRLISEKLEEYIINNTVPGDKNISLSLTGGADTRNLLAIFLKNGIKPHLYTYGNPDSSDCVKASIIANVLELEHSVYDIQMNEDLFLEYSKRIISSGGSLASIHRVHRLMAVEKEYNHADKMFLGTLGGEFIKGVNEDDYIVPAIVFDNWHTNELKFSELINYCERKRLICNDHHLKQIHEFLDNEPYFKGSFIEKKLNALVFITAHLHDAQDVNLYREVMNDVYTPFLDIEYLDLVFSSFYSFDKKETMKNRFTKRINNPVYSSKFLNVTYKPLMNFEYSGYHKPSEVLLNKYYAAIVKILRKRKRPINPPNFPLGDWMRKFVENHLPICNESEIISETFDIKSLLYDLRNNEHIPEESYWLKYTNPIMMNLIIEEYKS